MVRSATSWMLLMACAGVCACAGQVTPEQTQAVCDAIRESVQTSGYPGVPTRQQAIDSGNALDAVITMPADPALHDLSVSLHTQIHGIELAQEHGDGDAVSKLDAQWKDDVKRAAELCRFTLDEVAS